MNNSSEAFDRNLVWCLVPTYNNSSTLREVVEGCMRELPNVLVLDDGSTDAKVEEVLSDLDVIVLRHEENQGKGSAIMTAARYVENQGGLYMFTVDADGQHNPADIAKFLPFLGETADNVIIGIRDFNTDNVPGASRFGRSFANFWLRVESGVHVSDCQSGFRAYPVRHLNKLGVRGRRYDFEAEFLTRAAWAGLKFDTVDIQVKYLPRDERVSHFRPFMDNLRLTLTHASLVLRRLIPLPHKTLVEKKRVDWQLLLHPVKLLKFLLKEHANPSGLAAAAAVGVFLGALPLIFVHSIVILYVATRLNLNKVMALNAQHICMPPVVPALCIELGYYMRKGEWLTTLTFETVVAQLHDRFFEWLIGSLIIGPLLALLMAAMVYVVSFKLGNMKASDNA